MRWVGIDPGAKGAIALVGADGVLLDVVPMPSADGWTDGFLVAEVIDSWECDEGLAIVIEQVNSMPKQGVASSFKFGANFGLALGAAQSTGHPIHRLRPNEWKPVHTLTGKPKEASAARASELWPLMRLHWRLKKDVDKAEAALIAEAGRRKFG